MKKLILIALSLFIFNLNANELAWVDQQIEAIKPPRSGLKSSALSSLNNPFIFLKKNKDEKKEKKNTANTNTSKQKNKNTIVAKKKFSFSLTAVMNKSALINGKWYKTGEIVHGYKLSSVKPTSVVLKTKNKKLLLSTKASRKNLNFKNDK